MARLLALDIGTKRTGVAYLDEDTGVPLPLATIHHASVEALLLQIATLVHERNIDRLIVGFPLLPSGQEGAQSDFVRSVAEQLEERGWPVTLKDERYTTPRGKSADPDAIAALNLL